MPTCRECGVTQSSAELRKNPKGPVCLDKSACAKRREKEKK